MYESDREELVEILKERGIKSQSVLKAFLSVERHKFVSDAMIMHAYEDSALPIGYGQTISQPYTVAFMTEALNVRSGQSVLEIGTGSGYQAAILCAMGINVFSIERNEKLYNTTRKLLETLGYDVFTKLGDGTKGWESYAPYDGIIVTAGAPAVPNKLKDQLKIGGILVIPTGNQKSQTMQIIKKISEDRFEYIETPNFSFVPLIGKDGWKK
ncbi:MAG: protein-L-isoaspartate(D-aspartate) O-methyltransferase [Bacteroidetes bacterium]|nr:protein-L-isoaspartate(D-aspartate) O-methyltransferase [Bacteroidota bacterium]